MTNHREYEFVDDSGNPIVTYVVGKNGGIDVPRSFLNVRDQLSKARDNELLSQSSYLEAIDKLKELRETALSCSPRYAQHSRMVEERVPELSGKLFRELYGKEDEIRLISDSDKIEKMSRLIDEWRIRQIGIEKKLNKIIEADRMLESQTTILDQIRATLTKQAA